MLKLESGKRYWMRYGGVTGVVRAGGGAVHPFTDGMWKWTKDGDRFLDTPSDADLAREYTEPQPLEWKRGIPTEDECRECWIVYGGSGDLPTDEGRIYHPNHPAAIWRNSHWYLPLRVKPVEPPKPKTKTVTLCKMTHKSGGEVWWPEDAVFAMFYEWLKTGETKTVEVPCE